MSHVGHFICKCQQCQVVITQCGCDHPNKTVLWSVCEDCTAKN